MAKSPRPVRLDQKDEDSMMSAIGEEAAPASKEEVQPSYKMFKESKIPVSKVRGKYWKAKRDSTFRDMRDTFDAWEEGENYYHATQDSHRNETGTQPDISGNVAIRQRKNRIGSENENIVFANTTALVPSLYAKSPEITITGNNDEMKDLYNCVEEVGISIINRKTYPGVNLTPKVRKSIVSAAIANEGWIEIGWTFKEQSSEQSMADLKRLSDEFATTKDLKRLKEIEGEIAALEAKIEILTPSGPWTKYRQAKQVLTDPDGVDDDGSDAKWMMVWDLIPTNSLQAAFGEKDENGNWKSIYDPTHVMMVNDDAMSSVDEQVKNYRAFTEQDQTTKDRDVTLDNTKVWWVFDKITRRIELYHDKNWSWPIWVWDDRYNLDRFFPLYALKFHTSPCRTRMKGEISYYLDQQDAINEINDAESRARDAIKNNGFFDSNSGIDETTVQTVSRGSDGTWKGLKVPDGKKMEDIFFHMTPDVIKFPALFDDNAKNRKLQAIDRIASTSDVMRGAQFKTNTTNKAIETYNSISNTRLDDRIDSIENFIGDITWGLMQLCLQYMSVEVVAMLVGKNRAANWQTMTPEAILMSFASCRVVGGSTAKPTSRVKKEEAIQIGQVLGQFGQLAPGPVLMATFKLFEKAFDEFVMTDQDWKVLEESVFGAMGVANGGANEMTPEIQNQIAALPPEIQQAVMSAIEQGVPPDQALAKVQELTQTQGSA